MHVDFPSITGSGICLGCLDCTSAIGHLIGAARVFNQISFPFPFWIVFTLFDSDCCLSTGHFLCWCMNLYILSTKYVLLCYSKKYKIVFLD